MELIREAGIIIIILTGLFFLVYKLRRRNNSPVAIHGKLVPEPVEAKATILTIEQTGLTRHQFYQVKIQMQVFPEKGRNFVVEVKELLSLEHFAVLHTGVSVRVTYNPSNPKEVTLIKAA